MAQDYNIELQRYNGNDFDRLLPVPATHGSTHAHGSSDPLPAKSVTNTELADGAVSTGKIATSAVTAAKIKNGAVTQAYDIMFPVSGWEEEEGLTTWKQTVTNATSLEGLADTDVTILDLHFPDSEYSVENQIAANEQWQVVRAWPGSTSFTIRMLEKPTMDIYVRILAIRK